MYVDTFSILTFLRLTQFSQGRSKRVIDGIELNGRPTTYTAIRYYGAMGTAHGLPFFKELFKDFMLYDTITCSGTLLTPLVFQTACHCVASYNSRAQPYIKPPILFQPWETNSVVYVGLSKRFGENSMETFSPIKMERYLIHTKCGLLLDSQLVTYDFGLVQLDKDWIKAEGNPYPWIEIEFAPQYTIQEILNFEKFAVRSQMVCLHIGFGYFRWELAMTSDVLRTGWAVLLPEAACIIRSSVGRRRHPAKRILPHITWICTTNFSHHFQEIGGGDSGGPLTCNNRYVGVASGVSYGYNEKSEQSRKADYAIMSRFSPLSYDLYFSAVNYRKYMDWSFYRVPSIYDFKCPECKTPVTLPAKQPRSMGRFSLENQPSRAAFSSMPVVFLVFIIFI